MSSSTRSRGKRFPAENVVLHNAQLFARFVDQFSQLLGPVNNAFTLMCVFSFNHLSDLRVLPRRGEVKFAPALKFLLSFNVGVVDPLSLLERNVRLEGPGSLVESLDLFVSKSSVQDLKILAMWQNTYIREPRLAWKRLLLRYNLLAKYSLAPYLLEQATKSPKAMEALIAEWVPRGWQVGCIFCCI